MSVLDPLVSVLLSFCLLGLMLYKKVKLGIALVVTPIILALLTLNWFNIPALLYTTVDPFRQDGLLALLVILATFGSSWFSYLYKETKEITVLSEGLSNLVRKPKAILFFLPAIVGLISVPGGALLSAPIVDSESNSLGLSPEKRAYINVWFRHIIFPIYPLSQSLIVAAALTGIPLLMILLLQIPVIIVMSIIGYLIVLRGAASLKSNKLRISGESSKLASFMAFLPMLTAIALAIVLSTLDHVLFRLGFNVVIASFAGIIILAIISRSSLRDFIKPLANIWIYDATFATYGAFLLQNVMRSINIAGLFSPLVLNGMLSKTWMLTIIPVCLGFFMGSPSGAIAITASIFSSFFKFSHGSAALLYASAYFGYIISPTHLCLVFTVDYFKSSLAKVYKYILPSFIVTYLTALFLFSVI